MVLEGGALGVEVLVVVGVGHLLELFHLLHEVFDCSVGLGQESRVYFLFVAP